MPHVQHVPRNKSHAYSSNFEAHEKSSLKLDIGQSGHTVLPDAAVVSKSRFFVILET